MSSARPNPAILALVLVAAALARVSGAPAAFATGELVPLDDDSVYHLGRMTQGAEALPLPAQDRRMNWPRGALVPWSDGFDLLGVAILRVAGAAVAPLRAAVAVSLLPVVLGLLVVWATWSLAARLAPAYATGAAAAAAILAAFLPYTVGISRFARIDHHVLEALSLLLLAAWSIEPWEPRWAEGTAVRARVADELRIAGIAALAVAGFAGGTIYVALAVPVRFAAILSSRPRGLVGSGGPGLVAGGAATALLTWPGIAARGLALRFDGPSLLQPLLLAAAGGAVAVAGVAAAGTTGRDAARRAAVAAAAVAGLAGAAFAIAPFRAAILDGLFRFVLRRDPWLSGIQEFQPLLDGSPLPDRLRHFFGWLGPAAPFAAAGGVAVAWRQRRPAALAFGWYLLSVTALTLVQNRFGRVLSPLLAVAAGLSLAWLARELVRRWSPSSALAGACATLLAAGLVAADPGLRGALTPRTLPPLPSTEAALDLRAVPIDPTRPAVHAAWDVGHGLSVLGRRPVLTNGFGSFLDRDAFLESEQAFALAPDAYEAFLDRRQVGLVVAGPSAFRVAGPAGRTWYSGRRTGAVLDTEYLRAVPLAGLLIAGSALPGAEVRHLEHFMVRFASSTTTAGLSSELPLLWGYERVRGARLRGRAAPGTRWIATVPLWERGRRHDWRAFADADGSGRWEMIVPLPTSMVTPTVTTGSFYELRDGQGRRVPVRVPEAAVREGATLEVGAPPPAGR